MPSLHAMLEEMGYTPAARLPDFQMPRTPRVCQLEAVDLMLSNHRYGIFDEPGVGKTMPAQIVSLVHASVGNKCLIVMPPVLLKQFEEKLDSDFPDIRQYFSWHIVKEPPAKRQKFYAKWEEKGWPDILMMSYQMFHRLRKTKVELVKMPSGGKTPRVIPAELTGILEKQNYCVLIPDEAQKLKNPLSGVHECAADFVNREGGAAIYPMTGTPIYNTISDAYGLIKLINPGCYSNLDSFQYQHEHREDIEGRSVVVAFKNLDLLHANLYKCARRVTKGQVLQLKEPQIDIIDLELDPAHLKLYRKILNERWAELDGEVLDLTTQQKLRMVLNQVVSCPEKYDDDGKTVDNKLIEMIRELLDSMGVGGLRLAENGLPLGNGAVEKCIVFCYFNNTVESMMAKFKDMNPVAIYGGNTAKQNDAARIAFEDPTRSPLLFANPESGGVGLNFQYVCKYEIFAEPVGVPGLFKQAVDRVDRDGQLYIPEIKVIRALGTSFGASIRNMLRKANEAQEVVRDPKSLFDQMLGA